MNATSDTTIKSKMASHQSSPIPSMGMIMTRFMEMRKRKGLMIALIAVNIGIPTIFLAIRLIAHAVDPHSYGPAGGYGIFESLIAGLMYIFGFIVAATLGCSAGSSDLTDGMFRHLVVTGRSRLSIYFARIPAGLMIIVPIVATGIIIVCAVCVAAAPTRLSFDGINNMPVGLSQQGLITWAEKNPKLSICDLNINVDNQDTAVQIGAYCGLNGGPAARLKSPAIANIAPKFTASEIKTQAIRSAQQNYKSYSHTFLSPPLKLMIYTGLWVELWAVIGFLIGLGLSSLMGQRTVPVVLIIVYEIILTPLLSRVAIPHLINVQRGFVGLAMAHIEPSGLPVVFGGRGNGAADQVLVETTTVAIIVIISWIVVWTGLGAWRMAKRDA